MILVVDEVHDLADEWGMSVFRKAGSDRPDGKDRVVLMSTDADVSVVLTGDLNLGTVSLAVPGTRNSAVLDAESAPDTVISLAIALLLASGVEPLVYPTGDTIAGDDEALVRGLGVYEKYPW